MKNKEPQIILTIPDISNGIIKISTPFHGNETCLNKMKYAFHYTIFFMERVGGQH